MQKLITAVLIGAGDRGQTYSRIMRSMPDKFKIVAVAEPVESRRSSVRDMFAIDESRCYTDWRQLKEAGRLADIAIICTMDREHFTPAMEMMALGYDLLLEKPVSVIPEECEIIARRAEELDRKVIVCHVLRYTSFFTKIKSLICEGALGEVISINHEECVGNVHQSHSFVRGNWGNSQRASFMLLQKSCHDLDILQWLIDKPCLKLQSFGSLRYFRAENAPQGAPERCIDGCPHGEKCPYNAVKLYLEDKKNAWFRDACSGTVSPTDDEVEHALRTTQYGKCVYKCDNDVVDHQVTNMLFEDGVTVSFTMCAFNKGGRFIHIMGTKGELWGEMTAEEKPLRLFDFETRSFREISVSAAGQGKSGHGGGDEGLILALHEYLCGEYKGFAVSDVRISADNHHLAFAAERSRLCGSVIDMEEYKNTLEI